MAQTNPPSKESKATSEDGKPPISGDAKLDERFKFGPPPIQTPEDATMAFLREEINEEEYRTALGKFGILPGQIMKTGIAERPDAPFKNTIPSDIYNDQERPEDSLDARLEGVKREEDERNEAADKAAPIVTRVVTPDLPSISSAMDVPGTGSEASKDKKE
jgi:hypothetical protein